jgi:hypothetical protein
MWAASARLCAVACFAACFAACAANHSHVAAELAPAAADSAQTSLARACEDALAHVDALLAAREADPSFPADALAEARELRRVAIELVAGGDFALALELLGSSAALLEGAPE